MWVSNIPGPVKSFTHGPFPAKPAINPPTNGGNLFHDDLTLFADQIQRERLPPDMSIRLKTGPIEEPTDFLGAVRAHVEELMRPYRVFDVDFNF